MKGRTMDWGPRYGMDHPTWDAPTCFFYDSADKARESMVRTYGEGSGHIVVRMERVDTEPRMVAAGADSGAEGL